MLLFEIRSFAELSIYFYPPWDTYVMYLCCRLPIQVVKHVGMKESHNLNPAVSFNLDFLFDTYFLSFSFSYWNCHHFLNEYIFEHIWNILDHHPYGIYIFSPYMEYTLTLKCTKMTLSPSVLVLVFSFCWILTWTNNLWFHFPLKLSLSIFYHYKYFIRRLVYSFITLQVPCLFIDLQTTF